ncbi:hypothetical protein O0I10_006686 [Lichtheimia ornata]|uniref:Integrase catalytic domain-containing protein n=1 Tax=Lichtheimia ornata TaxID=688661 RepID=A0AAD7XYK5_9FUNG|nr:uncharacterized protein O0I10_006686 [Lichtheimia ornata]KAJ8657621.1 hypothetical protein O0I10_006686 [Lichtheimia ornata]
MSNALAHYLGRMKIKHKLTSAFHRTNAKAERTNGIVKQMIRKYVNGDINRWDDYVQQAIFACQEAEPTRETLAQGRVLYVRALREARLLAEQRLKNNAKHDKERWDSIMKPSSPYRILARNSDTHVSNSRHAKQHVRFVGSYRSSATNSPHSSPPTQPWYDPTSSRANIRQQLSTLTPQKLLEDDQQFREGSNT